ncbi:MAG: matrixin family metalloprotease, partial [Thermodesulfobacteriota bacterium]
YVKCEMNYDINGRIQSTIKDGDQAVIIDEWKHRWPDGIVTYRLNNLSPDIKNRKFQIRAITVAFRAWQLRIKDIRFKRERDPNKHVDINISFKPLSKFNNRRGVLAHAYFPGQGEISGDIEINDEWHWVYHGIHQTLSKPPLVPVLMHEIGHSLGLRHDTSSQEEIMYPSFDLGKRKYKLGPNTIKRIQGKAGFIGYGARSLSQRIIDYFIRRRREGYDYR